MPNRVVHDFTLPIRNLTWIDEARAYHHAAQNQLVTESGTRADSLERGLYLYLYSNCGESHSIRNKNKHHHPPNGAVVCPPGYCTLKSGKFQAGLHNHIRENVHRHLWRPETEPRQDHVTPKAMRWFLVFETDPLAPAPRIASQRTREKYFNSLVREWLASRGLNDSHQDNRFEHRWIPPHATTPTITAESGRGFLESLLLTQSDW